MNCIACNSTNLIEGKILDEYGFTFKPLDVSMWKASLGIGVREISAYGCIHCGYLQLIVNFTDEDKNRYIEFEGQQPDLLERIKSE